MTQEESKSMDKIVKKAKKIPTPLPRVEVVIPCYGPQQPHWWRNLMSTLLAENHKTCVINAVGTSTSMLQDDNKNKLARLAFNEQLTMSRRAHATDINRNQLARWALHPETDPVNPTKDAAEWLLYIDADTEPPLGFIGQLLSAKRPFMSGLYFLPAPPFNPVAYMRRAEGLYEAFYGYQLGELREVDSVGMGCALIHVSVFQEIQKQHTVYQDLTNGSLKVIFNKDIRNTNRYTGNASRPFVANGIMNTPVKPVDWAEENDPWPFFALEYARTEDHYFCELANNVGIKPYLDTNVVCGHDKDRTFTEKDYQENKDKYMENLQMKVRHHER
jgi:hypothetical protein